MVSINVINSSCCYHSHLFWIISMKFKTITTVSAILTILNAISFLFFPEYSLSLLGRTTNLVGIMNTRIAGACALGLGIWTWSARNTKLQEVRRTVYIGNITTFGILIFVDLNGILESAINEIGWLIFFIDFLIFGGFITSIFTCGGRNQQWHHIWGYINRTFQFCKLPFNVQIVMYLGIQKIKKRSWCLTI